MAAGWHGRNVIGAWLGIGLGTWALCPAAAHADAPDPQGTCLNAPYTVPQGAPPSRVQAIVAALRSALTEFAALLEALDTARPEICLVQGLVVEQAYYDPGANRIALSADMPDGLMLAVLVHELRHVEQFARGICPSEALSMKSHARAVLALEADANVVMHLVAWQQREAGNAALWTALEGWSMTSDITTRFARVLEQTGRISAAASAAFDQWYASDTRYTRYYVASCSDYLDRQDDSHALPSYRGLAADYLERLCVLPDGARYPCSDTDPAAR